MLTATADVLAIAGRLGRGLTQGVVGEDVLLAVLSLLWSGLVVGR